MFILGALNFNRSRKSCLDQLRNCGFGWIMTVLPCNSRSKSPIIRQRCAQFLLAVGGTSNPHLRWKGNFNQAFTVKMVRGFPRCNLRPLTHRSSILYLIRSPDHLRVYSLEISLRVRSRLRRHRSKLPLDDQTLRFRSMQSAISESVILASHSGAASMPSTRFATSDLTG